MTTRNEHQTLRLWNHGARNMVAVASLFDAVSPNYWVNAAVRGRWLVIIANS
jgi:hypothetical protein